MKGGEVVQNRPPLWVSSAPRRGREKRISTERHRQIKIPFSSRRETHTWEEKPDAQPLLHYSLLHCSSVGGRKSGYAPPQFPSSPTGGASTSLPLTSFHHGASQRAEHTQTSREPRRELHPPPRATGDAFNISQPVCTLTTPPSCLTGAITQAVNGNKFAQSATTQETTELILHQGLVSKR